MTTFMTQCLYVIVGVFRGFPLLTSILALAIICSTVTVIKSLFGGYR